MMFARPLVIFTFTVISSWTVAKGILPLFHTDELYFWLTTYQDGLVRRGLIGTLLVPLLGSVTATQVHAIGAACCLSGLTATVALASSILWNALPDKRASTICLSALLFAASPFLGLIAFHIGYPDSLISSFVLVCGMAFSRVSATVISIVLFTCSAVHELVFLVVLPLAIFACLIRKGWGVKEISVVGIGAVGGFLIALLGNHIPPELVDQLARAGLSPREAHVQVETSLQQTVVSAASRMRLTWQNYPLNGLIGVIYAGLPGFFIASLGLPSAVLCSQQRTNSRLFRHLIVIVYLVCCLSSLALLLIAWDLARLVSFTTVTAFVTTDLVMRQAFVKMAPKALAVAGILIVSLVCFPILNLYFDYGRALHINMISKICWPCARVGLATVDYFNRGLTPAQRTAIDTDKQFDSYVKKASNP